MSKLFRSAVCAFAALAMFGASVAQAAYPERTVKLVSMGAPGSVNDLIARQLAAMLTKELGQQFVVLNQGGAGGNMAVNTLLQARPDGYTIAAASNMVFSDNLFNMDVRYKLEDLAPISAINNSCMAVIALPDKGWKTVGDAFKAAKAENRALKAAVMDNRSRFILEGIAKQEGVQLAPIPQPGGTPILTSVLGGHSDIGIVGTIAVDNTKAGKIVTLASASSTRFSALPEVSTLKEQGYNGVFDTQIFLFTSSKVDPAIVETLSSAMIKISQTPEYKDLLNKFAVEPIAMGSAEAKKLIQEGYESAKALYQK